MRRLIRGGVVGAALAVGAMACVQRGPAVPPRSAVTGRIRAEPALREEPELPAPGPGAVEAGPPAAPSPGGAAEVTRRWSLEELLREAAREQPRLAALRARVEQRVGERSGQLAAFLPRADLDARFLLGTEPFVLPSVPTSIGNVALGGANERFLQAQLGVETLLWDFGAALGRYRAAERRVDVAALELQRAEQTVALEVTVGALDVLRAQALLGVALQGVSTAEIVLGDTMDLQARGDALVEDVAQARVVLRDMELKRQHSETRLTIARAALNRSIGRHVASTMEVEEIEAPVGPVQDLDSSLAVAAAERDDLGAALAAIDAAGFGAAAAEADFFPRLLAGGTALWSDGASHEPAHLLYGGLSVELNLFEGGRTLANAETAAAAQREVVATAKALADAIALEVISAHARTEDWRRSIALGESAVRAATLNLELQRARFGRGDATSTDLAEAELELVQSEADLVDAHYGFQAALATLAYATGVLELPPRL